MPLLTAVLGILSDLTGEEQIAPRTPVMEAGIDSLSVMQFVDRLHKRTGLKVAPTVIFEHTTVQALATHLAQLSGVCTHVPLVHRGRAVQCSACGRCACMRSRLPRTA